MKDENKNEIYMCRVCFFFCFTKRWWSS